MGWGEIMIDVLAKINRLRKERNWTIYKLSEEAMVSQSTMSNMFTRKTMPSLYTLDRICDAFGITLSEFFDNCSDDADESKIISLFRQLNQKDRETLIALATHLRQNSD